MEGPSDRSGDEQDRRHRRGRAHGNCGRLAGTGSAASGSASQTQRSIGIDPVTNTVQATIKIPVEVLPCGSFAFTATDVWIQSCSGRPTIARIDPATNVVAGVIRPAGPVSGPNVINGAAWVSLDTRPATPVPRAPLGRTGCRGSRLAPGSTSGAGETSSSPRVRLGDRWRERPHLAPPTDRVLTQLNGVRSARASGASWANGPIRHLCRSADANPGGPDASHALDPAVDRNRAALAGLTLAPVSASYPGHQNGRVAFGIRAADDSSNIFSVRPDGPGLKQLTTGPDNHFCPAYSADGRRSPTAPT